MCFTTISEGEKKITTDLFIDLSGHEDGQVTLWQFEQSLSLSTFISDKKAAITRVHFDSDGSRFLATDESGYLNVWRFDTAPRFVHPFSVCRNLYKNDEHSV
jgi:WD40 repeat protein